MSESFTAMAHETHGQCFCGPDPHCHGGLDCEGGCGWTPPLPRCTAIDPNANPLARGSRCVLDVDGHTEHADAFGDTFTADQPDPTAWRDRFGDLWRLGADGRLHSPETNPFPREHVERKWGPLIPDADPPPMTERDIRHMLIDAAVSVIEPCVTNRTAAWNTWNEIASNPVFVDAIVEVNAERLDERAAAVTASRTAVADLITEVLSRINDPSPQRRPDLLELVETLQLARDALGEPAPGAELSGCPGCDSGVPPHTGRGPLCRPIEPA